MTLDTDAPASAAPLLRLDQVRKHFGVRKGAFGRVRGIIRAVDNVSFSVYPGETLGLVGESGCGKSTLAKLIVRLHTPTGGRIEIDGIDISMLSESALRPLRRKVQMVFQDPYSSLNPRMKAGQIVAEPLAEHGLGKPAWRKARVAELFDRVGLQSALADSYPNEFSGGQRQRVGIARALALEPRLIVADEPVSALDVSVQAQVINLLFRLREALKVAFVFISHDLAVVEHISDRVAVMYMGQLVEIAAKRDLFAAPRHPYTETLMAAVPRLDARKRRPAAPIGGEMPSPLTPPSGCRFRTRCPLAQKICSQAAPPLNNIGKGHLLACHIRSR